MTDILDTITSIADDTVLPEQFFDRASPQTPEQHLVRAVLEDALRVYANHRLDGHQLRGRAFTQWKDAYDWLTDSESHGLFSLRWCCDMLSSKAAELDPVLVAERIRTLAPVAAPRHNPIVRQTLHVPNRRKRKSERRTI